MNQIEAMKQALEELSWHRFSRAEGILRIAIEQALSNKENIMPITDDHGVATTRQFRVIEQRGRWQLLFDMHQIGNTVHHEFRIQKLRHDIALYPGITLDEAKKRFAEKVEADRE